MMRTPKMLFLLASTRLAGTAKALEIGRVQVGDDAAAFDSILGKCDADDDKQEAVVAEIQKQIGAAKDLKDFTCRADAEETIANWMCSKAAQPILKKGGLGEIMVPQGGAKGFAGMLQSLQIKCCWAAVNLLCQGGMVTNEDTCKTASTNADCEGEHSSTKTSENKNSGASFTGPKPVGAPDLSATFWRFPFCREVQMSLVAIGIASPTFVQEMAIPRLLEGQSMLLIGQTGTGKTLAYIAPIVNRLLSNDPDKVYPEPQRPRALILCPRRGLCDQALAVLRKFPIRSASLAAGNSYVKERRALSAGADVCVATPWRLLLHMQNSSMSLHNVESLVVDEADMLCDTFYEKEVQQIVKELK
eukprot:gene201-820_t